MIFAGGKPRVRTEGFGICAANDNLPQRSPNMKKDPMGRFLCLIIFMRLRIQMTFSLAFISSLTLVIISVSYLKNSA